MTSVEKMKAASKRTRIDLGRHELGLYLGRMWRMERAEAEQIARLGQLRELCDRDWSLFFKNDNSSAWGVGERLYFVIDPACNRSRKFAADFWDAVLDGDDRTLAANSAFVRGFAEGAVGPAPALSW